jgi:hypothetical protein
MVKFKLGGTFMLLVTEGKYKINQLGYNKKTSEYVYFHKGKEIWREKGDDSLLNYFNSLRESYSCINEEEIAKFPIYKKYEESCDEFERKERKLW